MRPLVRLACGRTGERGNWEFWLCARNAGRAGENSHCAGSAARILPGEKGSRGVFRLKKGLNTANTYIQNSRPIRRQHFAKVPCHGD